MKKLVEYTPIDPTAVSCKPRPGDVRKDPARCVIHNHIEESYPWARLIKVGVDTISLYDYRCEHNPEGKVRQCFDCPRKKLVWRTPFTAAEAIREFDRGDDPEFPAIQLREDEAKVETGIPWDREGRKNDVERRKEQRAYLAKKREEPDFNEQERQRHKKSNEQNKARRRAS